LGAVDFNTRAAFNPVACQQRHFKVSAKVPTPDAEIAKDLGEREAIL